MRSIRTRPVVHLELHTGDLPARARASTPSCAAGAPSGSTPAAAPTSRSTLGGGLGGGIVECGTERPLWLPYVEVADVAAATERARALGASVLLEPREGPAGWRSVVAAPAAAKSRSGSPSASARGRGSADAPPPPARARCGAVRRPVAEAKTVWLCKPGQADNPCSPGLKTTLFSPAGKKLGREPVRRARPQGRLLLRLPDGQRPADRDRQRDIDPEQRSIALYQAARYSSDCRVFAPVYRQLTLARACSAGRRHAGAAGARLRATCARPGATTCATTTTAAAWC